MMKSKKTGLAVLILCVLAILIASLFVKDMLVRSAICKTVAAQTGFGVSLDAVDYNPFKTTIELRGLVLENPEDFGGTSAIEIKRAYIDTSLASLFGETMALDVCELDIGSIRVVAKGDGETNLERLAGRIQDQSEPQPVPPSTPAPQPAGQAVESARPPADVRKTVDKGKDITIDRLKIHLGKAIVETSTVGGRQLAPKVYEINQTVEFENVDDLDPVAQQIMMLVAIKTGPDLIRDMSQMLEENKDDVENLEQQFKEKAGEAFKNIFK